MHPSHSNLTYGPLTDAQLPQLVRNLQLAFCVGSDESCIAWIDRAGREHVRTLTDPNSALLGSLFAIPMGQYFGGRSISMQGIVAVAVPPEARGKGIAAHVMNESVRDGRAEGFAISTLFAATQQLYRMSGYEQAGHCCELKLAASRIDTRERDLEVRSLTRDDLPQMKQVWNAMAAPMTGQLDRPPYIWNRVFEMRKEPAQGLGVINDAGDLEGYIWYIQTPGPRGERYSVTLTDLAAATPRALRRIATLLAGMSSTVEDIAMLCGPHHPLLYVLGEQRYTLRRREYWMTRILDVKTALEARGYPANLTCDIHFDITDPLFADNTGSFILRIKDGAGHVSRGGNGSIQLEIKALAPLYAGFMSPHELALSGAIKGDAAQLALAATAFAGPTPGLNDMF